MTSARAVESAGLVETEEVKDLGVKRAWSEKCFCFGMGWIR
jgi:hypothetical protein